MLRRMHTSKLKLTPIITIITIIVIIAIAAIIWNQISRVSWTLERSLLFFYFTYLLSYLSLVF